MSLSYKVQRANININILDISNLLISNHHLANLIPCLSRTRGASNYDVKKLASFDNNHLENFSKCTKVKVCIYVQLQFPFRYQSRKTGTHLHITSCSKYAGHKPYYWTLTF